MSEATKTRRELLAGINPVALIEMLDIHFDDDGSRSTYRRLYRDAKRAFLEDEGHQAVSFDALIREIDGTVGIEEAMRRAGFVQGFEICRLLMLGELDLASLKVAGADDDEAAR